MERHWRLSDSEFEKQFETNTFRPLWFTHEAHLRLAWIHIEKYQAKQAFKNYSSQLIAFANKYNADGKYNATVTYASIQIMQGFMKQSNSENFKDFIAEFPQLKSNFKEVISTHYSGDIFKSTEAKQQILKPDLTPF